MLLGVLLGISIALNVGLFVAGFRLFNEVENLEFLNEDAQNKIDNLNHLLEVYKTKNTKLEDENLELHSAIREHKVIFDQLEEDPMCLAKALTAWEDIVDRLTDAKDYSLADKVCNDINLKYDSTTKNYYSSESDKITISLFQDTDNEQRDFLFEYLNETFGTNLQNDIRTNIVFTVLHELGHYVDYFSLKRIGAKEFEFYLDSNWDKKEALDKMEYGPEMWRAYRKIPDELEADNFAIVMMTKLFPELCWD